MDTVVPGDWLAERPHSRPPLSSYPPTCSSHFARTIAVSLVGRLPDAVPNRSLWISLMVIPERPIGLGTPGEW
jgi:hypothetical protein